jgi:putative SOS response-associated peptidase YedK
MCGRVVQSSGPPRCAIVHGLNVRDSRVSNYPPRWNAAPNQELLVIRRNHHTGEVSLDPLRWGLIPYWCKDPTGKRKPINAKAETLAKLPSFREAYRKRRCIVPVDGFFEWKAIKGRRAKQPYAIAMKNGSPFGIAGIWENWKDPKTGEWLRTFAIITTDANTVVADRVVCGARECKHASGVSNFAQTPDGQSRNLISNRYPIARRSVFNSTKAVPLKLMRSSTVSLRVQSIDTSVQDEISRLVTGRDHAQRFHRTGSYLYCASACNGQPRGRSRA